MDNYFIQAQRVRRLVQQDFNTVFAAGHPLAAVREPETTRTDAADVDVIVCPTAPSPPPRLADVSLGSASSPLDAYVNDVFTVPASLAGLPAVSVPVIVSESEQNPDADELAGIQVIGQYGDDELVMKVGELLEGRRLDGWS